MKAFRISEQICYSHTRQVHSHASSIVQLNVSPVVVCLLTKVT